MEMSNQLQVLLALPMGEESPYSLDRGTFSLQATMNAVEEMKLPAPSDKSNFDLWVRKPVT
jgi:hypothetical protein